MACVGTDTINKKPQGRKRQSESEEMTPKKAKVTFTSGKNPVQLLHEKFVTIEYDYTQEGRFIELYQCTHKKLSMLFKKKLKHHRCKG